MSGLGAEPLRYGRNHRLSLRPAARCGTGLPDAAGRRASQDQSTLGRQARRRTYARHSHARRHLRDGADARRRDRHGRGRAAQHLRSGPQPDLPDFRGGARLSPRHSPHRHRRLRDGLFRLSGLPRRHHQGASACHQSRHGSPLRPAHAADVARQGGDMAACVSAWRRSAGGTDPLGFPFVLSRRPDEQPRMGLRLRRMPGLPLAQ